MGRLRICEIQKAQNGYVAKGGMMALNTTYVFKSKKELMKFLEDELE